MAHVPAPSSGTHPSAEPPADTTSPPGYEVLRQLGRGGMGVVYLARQKALKRLVALKMILAGSHAGSEARARFRIEAEAAARLQHPNIVQVYEVGEHEGLPFFSLEYVEGGSLDGRLNGNPVSPREAAALVEVLARAMQHAHEQDIVHRDLKPANVLLSRNVSPSLTRPIDSSVDTVRQLPDTVIGAFTDSWTPKITDFGCAKQLDSIQAQTQTGAVVGTPSYMAPEQASGTSIGPAADVWALGAILYELLTGRAPFRGPTPLDTVLQVVSEEPVPPARLAPRTPRDLETICLKCLQKEAHRRYGSALELADDLRRFLDGRPIQGRQVSVFERSLKWARRKPAMAGLLAVSVVAVIVLLAVWFAFTTELRAERNHALEQKEEAQRQEGLAQDNAKEARRQADRARASEAEAQQEMERGRRSLFTAQVWRAAGLWEKDPGLAADLLNDPRACPPDLRDFSWRLYRRLTDIERPTLLGPNTRDGDSNEVFALAVSRFGRRVATGGADGSVRLWNLDTGKQTAVLQGHAAAVRSVAFSKDGQRLVSGSDDRSVRLWDVATAQPLGVLGRHPGCVAAVAFNPDGKSVASGSGKRSADNPGRDTPNLRPELMLWDVSTGKGRSLYADQPAVVRLAVTALAFSPDGKLVASGHPFRVFARLWETDTGKLQGELPRRSGGVIHAVAFAPGGKVLATAGGDFTVKLWNVETRQELPGRSPLRGHVGEVYDVCYSADGRFLVSASADRTCKLWDPLTGEERTTLRAGGPVRRVALGPTGKRILLAASDRVLQFALPSYPEQAPLTGHAAQVAGLVPSPDGRRVAASLRNQVVGWWDVTTARILGSWPPRDFFLAAVAWSPDGTILAAAGATLDADAKRSETYKHSGHDLRFYHLGRRTGHFGWRGKGPTITAIAFHPGGTLFATGSEDGSVRLWRLTWGPQGIPRLGEKPLWTVGPERGAGGVLAVGFLGDGATVFAARSSGVRLWQAEDGKELVRPQALILG